MSLYSSKEEIQEKICQCINQLKLPTMFGDWHSYLGIYYKMLNDLDKEIKFVESRISQLEKEAKLESHKQDWVNYNISMACIAELRGVLGK